MVTIPSLRLSVVALAVLLFASSTAFAQQRGFGAPMNARSTTPYARVNTIGRVVLNIVRPQWQQSGPQWRQATTQDLINAQYLRNLQQHQRPPDYPASAWQMLQYDNAGYRVMGNSYRPPATNMIIIGSEILNNAQPAVNGYMNSSGFYTITPPRQW